MDKKVIDPQEWQEFLSDFSERNRGRRARFETFSRGSVAEEDEEGTFESIAIDSGVVSVGRESAAGHDIGAEITDVRGITVQLDSDGSENTMEFMDTNGDMTVLHFESMVDGES